MKLFHYTSTAHAKLIRKDLGGICKGMIPTINPLDPDGDPIPGLGVQWLTVSPDWDEQDWDPQKGTYHPKTAVRYEIEIPKPFLDCLISWRDFERKVHPELAAYLQTFPSSRFWYVFIGHIPHEWIYQIHRNPNPFALPSNG